MLKIAYCDDIKTDREKIISSLSHIESKWNEEFEIESFSNGEDLCENLIENHYDIVLLDILMDGIDGIEVATRIRSLGEDVLIIFISSYDNRLKEMFDFRTIAFIDKPLETEKLEEALRKAYNIIKKDNTNIFCYKKGGSLQYVPLKEIIYLESRRNEIIIHTNKYKDSYYNTISTVWAQLSSTNQFVMPHRSFIFNLSYVTLKSNKIVVRDTDEIYNIGERYKADTEERYLQYLEKRWM